MRKFVVALYILFFGWTVPVKAQSCADVCAACQNALRSDSPYNQQLGGIIQYCNACNNCGGQAQPQPQDNRVHCGGGSFCQAGTTCCGSMCCGSGNYCSKYGCIQEGSIECGGYYCNPGQRCASGRRCAPQNTVDCGTGTCPEGSVCWSARAAIPGVANRGEFKCPTPEMAEQLDAQVAEIEQSQKIEREMAAARKKREAEEKKAAELKRAQEKREAALQKERDRQAAIRRQEEEKRAAAQRKEQERLDAIAKKKEEEQRRLAEKKKQEEDARLAAAKAKSSPSSGSTTPPVQAGSATAPSRPQTALQKPPIQTAQSPASAGAQTPTTSQPSTSQPSTAAVPPKVTSDAAGKISKDTDVQRLLSDPTISVSGNYGRTINGSIVDLGTGAVVTTGGVTTASPPKNVVPVAAVPQVGAQTPPTSGQPQPTTSQASSTAAAAVPDVSKNSDVQKLLSDRSLAQSGGYGRTINGSIVDLRTGAVVAIGDATTTPPPQRVTPVAGSPAPQAGVQTATTSVQPSTTAARPAPAQPSLPPQAGASATAPKGQPGRISGSQTPTVSPPPAAPLTGSSKSSIQLTPPNQTSDIWARVGNAAKFTLKDNPTNPTVQSGVKDLKVHGVVMGVGCVVGGGAAAIGSAGVGAGPGCLGGMVLAEAVYGAGSFGISVADGMRSAFQGQYGQGLRQIVTAGAEHVAEQVTKKPVPVGAVLKLVGAPVGTFLGAFYENVPAQ